MDHLTCEEMEAFLTAAFALLESTIMITMRLAEAERIHGLTVEIFDIMVAISNSTTAIWDIHEAIIPEPITCSGGF